MPEGEYHRYGQVAQRDGQGRKRCSKRSACLAPDGPWQSESAFPRNRSHADGLASDCKACRKASRLRSPVREPSGCLLCGGYVESAYGRYCADCGSKGRRNSRRLRPGFICVDRRHPEWWDGWFSRLEMNEMLKNGYWPDGIRFQERHRGVVRIVVVVGPQMRPQRLEVTE